MLFRSGTDLLAANDFQKVPYPRILIAKMVTGSAVAGDTEIELFVGQTRVTTAINTALGQGAANTDLYPMATIIPANVAIHAFVKVSPTTNPINVKLFWKP